MSCETTGVIPTTIKTPKRANVNKNTLKSGKEDKRPIMQLDPEEEGVVHIIVK